MLQHTHNVQIMIRLLNRVIVWKHLLKHMTVQKKYTLGVLMLKTWLMMFEPIFINYASVMPTLKYGLETMYMSNTQLKKLKSIQGTLLKLCLGLSVRSHHSKLIRAMNIVPLGEIVKTQYVACGIEFLWSTHWWEIYIHSSWPDILSLVVYVIKPCFP